MQTYFMFGAHSEKDIDPHEPSGPKIRFTLQEPALPANLLLPEPLLRSSFPPFPTAPLYLFLFAKHPFPVRDERRSIPSQGFECRDVRPRNPCSAVDALLHPLPQIQRFVRHRTDMLGRQGIPVADIDDECDLSDPLYEGEGVQTASTRSGTAFDIPSGLRGFENDVFKGRDDSVVPACGVPQYFYTHKR